MSLTLEQTHAITCWSKGHNTQISAVPGAGKSKVLVESCRVFDRGCALIVAYNRDLCLETCQKIEDAQLSDRVLCYTFHGLCCACIAEAFDDDQLHDAVEAAENNRIEVKKLAVKGVLIDECQDFREIFRRLLRVIVVPDIRVQYMVVGDENQMLYDYDEDDPADLKYMQNPSEYFVNGNWSFCRFTVSHRITPEMADLVSCMFDVELKSAKSGGNPVKIITNNMWKSGQIIESIIKQHNHKEIVILAEKKRNNGPLRAALNHLSSLGLRLYVNGLDGPDSRIKHGKLCISTFHASKGTEQRLVIVFDVNNFCARNPLYVALTRGKEDLYILHNENNPNENLIKALSKVKDGSVWIDDATADIAKRPIPQVERFSGQSKTRPLDYWRPKGSGRWLKKHINLHDYQNEISDPTDLETIMSIGNTHEAVGELYALACRLFLENELVKSVRSIDDILDPTRRNVEDKHELIINGCHSRIVPLNIPERALLANDMKKKFTDVMNKEKKTIKDWIVLAAVVRSWNDMHHAMRQIFPLHWVDEEKFEKACDFLREQIEMYETEFDVLQTMNREISGQTIYVRCHIRASQYIWHVVWTSSISSSIKIEACIRAALAKRTVIIVNLCTLQTSTIQVVNSEEMIEKMCN